MIRTINCLSHGYIIPELPPISRFDFNIFLLPECDAQVQTIREMVKDTMVHTAEPAEVRNKATLTKPFMQTKGISCRPHTTTR